MLHRSIFLTLPTPCFGALALELRPGATLADPLLPLTDAQRIAEGVALDLARIAPGIEAGDLTLAGATFDPAELLRPGWPVHTALARLAARAPGPAGGRVVAFGAREGRIAEPALMPVHELSNGPLRLLPWCVLGDAGQLAASAAMLEADLLDRGMVNADTALTAQEAFGVAIEHARLLTIYDLAALTAMQYRHAGLDALWSLIETVLLQPTSECLIEGDGPTALYRSGRVHIAQLDKQAFITAGFATDMDEAVLTRAFAHWQARERQYAAVLNAHAIPIELVAIDDAENAGHVLRLSSEI